MLSAVPIDLRTFGNDLLTGLLEFAVNAIPGALGAGLSVAAEVADSMSADDEPDRPGSTPRTVAAVGVAAELDPAQWRYPSSPLWAAFRSGTLVQVPAPIETGDSAHRLELGESAHTSSPRAELSLASVPGLDAAFLAQVKGAVFSPGEWGGELPVVLSLYLDRPAAGATLRELDKYEPVITQALSVVEYCAGEQQVAQQMLQMTQYRRVIEQAKGLVMGAVGADATAAFATLVRASQHFNVRLRHLAVALVELVGDGVVEHPEDPSLVIRTTDNEREIAGRVWAALTTRTDCPRPGGGPAVRPPEAN